MRFAFQNLLFVKSYTMFGWTFEEKMRGGHFQLSLCYPVLEGILGKLRANLRRINGHLSYCLGRDKAGE